jgi:Fe-S-cluster containining protein
MISTHELLAKLSAPEREALSTVGQRVGVVMESHAPRSQKYFRLVQIANRADAARAPHTPCGLGCAHCCKIAVTISAREAARIAAYTRRRAATLPAMDNPRAVVERIEHNVERYTGKPCAFLGAQNECEVYPVRPLACREYHSLNDTPDACDTVANPGAVVPRFNLQALAMAAVCLDADDAFGDIREFFP